MDIKYVRMRAQLAVLREVARQYGGRTIENVIMNYEAILREMDKKP